MMRPCFLALLLSVALTVKSYHTGAPAAACTRIYPEGHNGQSQNLQSSPFALDLSQMHNQLGNVYYSPGYSYTLTLAGGNFRGFLIQARSSVSGTPLGKFSVGGDGSQQLSQCSPPESAVTHTSNSLKNNVSLTWTAPAPGSGPITFYYAVVVQNSAGVSTFYATLNSSKIPEGCAAPQYRNGSTCVNSCPPYYYGNYTTRLCLPLPSDYTVALNATFYDASFLNTTPIDTVLFGFTVYFNPMLPLGTTVIVSIDRSSAGSYSPQDYFGFTTVYGGSPYSYSFPYSLTSTSDYILTDQIKYIAKSTVSTFQFRLQLLPDIDTINVGSTIFTINGLCQANCYNGGACVYIGNFITNCTCAPGFNGTSCYNDINNYCTLTTCQNGGTCNEGYGTSTSCTCAPGFSGKNCSNDLNFCTNATCQNGGTCNEGYGTSTSCTCAPGFSGKNCIYDLNYCTAATCPNGGTCVEGYGISTSCIFPPISSGSASSSIALIPATASLPTGSSRVGVIVGVPLGVVFGGLVFLIILAFGVYLVCIRPHRAMKYEINVQNNQASFRAKPFDDIPGVDAEVNVSILQNDDEAQIVQ